MKASPLLLICLFSGSSIVATAQALSPTTTTVVALPNPQVQGSPVVVVVSVATTSGSEIPTGSVNLSLFGISQSFPLDDGQLALEVPGTITSQIPAGGYPIMAAYSGDANNAASSGSVTETITTGGNLIATTTTLTSSANPVTAGATVTFDAFVQPTSGNGVPTGVIIGSLDGDPEVIVPVDSTGHGTYSTTLTEGQHTISAQYLGDSNFSTSTGNLTETVNEATSPMGALQFIPATPCRIADTRGTPGPFGGPQLAAQSSREFDIPQSPCNIPPTAVAYSLNVTAVPDGALNYLTLWPTGEPQPNVSTLNSDGRVKANAAITPAGANGGVNVFVSDASNVILDIDGYFVPAGTASALAFYPLIPCRIADTRNAAGPLGGPSLAGGSSRDFPIQSSDCSLPPNAQAYSLNVTAIPHSTLNYLTTWPTGEVQPNVSTLNSPTGAVTANAAIVPAGRDGDVSIFVYDAADVIVDVNGYFAPPASGGLSLYTTTPCRVIDTRPGAFNSEHTVNVETSICAPPSTAQAYVLNATVVPTGSLNYLSLWPDLLSQPNVSTLNADDGAVTSNMAIVPTVNGSIDAYAYGTTNLILDLSSYFAP